MSLGRFKLVEKSLKRSIGVNGISGGCLKQEGVVTDDE